MKDERRDAGPYDREIDAALAWVHAQGGARYPFNPFSPSGDHWCALAAVVEWYQRHRDVIAALDEWYARHREWYAATTPGQPLTNPKAFDKAHYEMAAAWQRVVKALESVEKGGER